MFCAQLKEVMKNKEGYISAHGEHQLEVDAMTVLANRLPVREIPRFEPLPQSFYDSRCKYMNVASI